MELSWVYLVKVSGILALFLGVYQIFLKRETFFVANRHFLLGGILGAFALPFLEFRRYVEVEPLFITEMAITEASTIGAMATEGPDWSAVMGAIYLLGLFWFGGKFLIQLLSLFMLIKGNRIRKIGGVRYVETQKDLAPFSFFNYIVYNPNQFSKAELQAIRQHEKAHCEQGHSVDMLLAHVMTIVLWFNPLSWLYKRHIQQNLEFLADSSAVRQTKSIRNYQYALLKVSSSAAYNAITNNFYTSLIKKRIIMLHKSKSSRLRAMKFMIIIPLLAGFLFAFNTEVVAQVKEKDVIAEVEIRGIEITIDKDYTEAQMESDINFMKEQGIELNFKGVKRNRAGEITTIRASYEDENGMSGNFSQKGDTPIKPFSFRLEGEGDDYSMGFFTGMPTHKAHAMNENFTKKIVLGTEQDLEEGKPVKHKKIRVLSEDNKGAYTWTASGDEDEKEILVEVKNGKKIIKIDGEEVSEEELQAHQVKAEGQRIKIKKIDKGEGGNVFILRDSMDEEDMEIIGKEDNSFFFVDSGKGDKTIYIIDGKEVKTDEFKDLSPHSIEKVEILKGEAAKKEYGDRAKDGVIKITTKEN
jgi:hypothetical protein